MMQSSLISKIDKARRYAQERDRAQFQNFSIQFRGEHDRYHVDYHDGQWHCDCHFFAGHGTCSHTMALERMLGGMLPRGAASSEVIPANHSADLTL